MDTPYFDTPRMKRLMNDYRDFMRNSIPSDAFETERNEIIDNALSSILEFPAEWDELTHYNVDAIGTAFASELESMHNTDSSINMLFTSIFRFMTENTLLLPEAQNRNHIIKKVKDFGIYKYNNFDDRAKGQLDYALREMPINIVSDFIKGENVKTYKDFLDCIQEGRDFKDKWESYINEEKEKIQSIKSTLEGYESAFNFVGLYDGFNYLGNQKKTEILWSRAILILLAFLIPLPLLYEFFFILPKEQALDAVNKMITLIPFLSLTLILIYYFRVVLLNYQSIRTQIMQIELRKSLCQFIQSYSDYARSIKDSNPQALVKFEEIIFSNIMSTDEKIPSTFDGIEQIASLISSFKPSK